jgi:thiol-disulfide isomerase/thioredoxin
MKRLTCKGGVSNRAFAGSAVSGSIVAISLIVVFAPALLRAAPTTQQSSSDAPNSAMASTAPDRDFQAVMADVQSALNDFNTAVPSLDVLADPAQRAAAAPTAIPVLRRLDALSREIAKTAGPGPQVAQEMGSQFGLLLLAFGDADSLEHVKADLASSDPAVAAAAREDQLFADWAKYSNDVVAQGKLVGTARELAVASPTDEAYCRALEMMSELGSASPDLAEQIKTVAAGMQTSLAPQVADELAGDRKVQSYEKKPLVITGQTVEGKAFSTADWRGKVILVDFWATWCGPCRGALPRVKKVYADYHARGLEVLGVSNDYDPKKLASFVAADPGMPWPQLLDANAAADHQWNPITEGFGITGIPTMFLIDKRGVLRSVHARADFETQIPRLLAE